MFARNGVYNDCAFDIRAAEQPDGFVLHLADPEGDAVLVDFKIACAYHCCRVTETDIAVQVPSEMFKRSVFNAVLQPH